MNEVLITGGSGLIGRHLSDKLKEKGYQVSTIGRRNNKHSKSDYFWDIKKEEIDIEAFEKADYIIHLAGAGISDKRWTKKRKQEILDSRVIPVHLMLKTIKNLKNKPKAFISSSAIGYYGTNTSSTIFEENSPAGNDFLGQVCNKWESEVDKFKDIGIRTVKIRTGITLTNKGGALSKMITPFKMGIGSPLGKGNQYMPWIHIEDLCNIYIKAIEDQNMNGAFNAVAPEDIKNKEFSEIASKILGKAMWLPNVPTFILKFIFGEMSDMILKGSRVSPKKIINTDYDFIYTDLESALNQLLD